MRMNRFHNPRGGLESFLGKPEACHVQESAVHSRTPIKTSLTSSKVTRSVRYNDMSMPYSSTDLAAIEKTFRGSGGGFWSAGERTPKAPTHRIKALGVVMERAAYACSRRFRHDHMSFRDDRRRSATPAGPALSGPARAFRCGGDRDRPPPTHAGSLDRCRAEPLRRAMLRARVSR
jgi:hypothetical protein